MKKIIKNLETQLNIRINNKKKGTISDPFNN